VARGAPACLETKALTEERTLLFVDESAFYPLPGVVRTWAPRGQTPVLRHLLTHDHLSVISAVIPDGRLVLQMQETAFASAGIIAFLDTLQAQVPGKLLVIWDGAPIHRSRMLKGYLSGGASARLHLERLPGYAPELNPAEGVWHYLKHVEMGNVCCRDLSHLPVELTAAMEGLGQKPELIRACFQKVGYFRDLQHHQ
jgi:transposase